LKISNKQQNLPYISVGQMKEVDRLMEGKFHISLIQMMENAGRAIAHLTEDYLSTPVSHSTKITVLCGTGNNGGGGMVAARNLSNRGYTVSVILIGDNIKLKPVPAHQWSILNELPLKQIIKPASNELDKIISNSDIIIDAMIGYGMTGELKGQLLDFIQSINNQKSKSIISLDAPTGFRFDQEVNPLFTVQASATLTLALPKVGMDDHQKKHILGNLYVGDISVPPALYHQMGISYNDPFGTNQFIRLN